MKKHPRKLNLCRETLLALERPALGNIAGGTVIPAPISPTDAVTCEGGPSYCCTMPEICGSDTLTDCF
jgi:hypothetical protein